MYSSDATTTAIMQDTRPIFALLTDFGYDFAVASMKALLLKDMSHATIIDIDHSLAKFSIVSGAFILGKTYQFFPKETTFIAVVDPGVGSDRLGICIKTEDYLFVGPNNGLFHYILQSHPDAQVYAIHDTLFLPQSFTFHGRDVFVPAALEYLRNPKASFFSEIDKSRLVLLEQLDIEWVVTYIDSFGNIKTNRSLHSFDTSRGFLDVQFPSGILRVPIARYFNEVPIGALFCYQGSNQTVEFAVRNGSASNYLGVTPGDCIQFVLL